MNALSRTRRLLRWGWGATRSKYAGNLAPTWDRLYSHQYGELMDGSHQRPRYLYLAGMLEDHFRRGARSLLDAGCGTGTLFGLIPRREIDYHGIDFSVEAVTRARQVHGDFFEVADLSNYRPTRTFDLLVLNEVLYYLPLARIGNELLRLRAFLNPGGTILVSMSTSPKAAIAWSCCGGLGPPTSRVRITNPALGISWTVKSFGVA